MSKKDKTDPVGIIAPGTPEHAAVAATLAWAEPLTPLIDQGLALVADEPERFILVVAGTMTKHPDGGLQLAVRNHGTIDDNQMFAVIQHLLMQRPELFAPIESALMQHLQRQVNALRVSGQGQDGGMVVVGPGGNARLIPMDQVDQDRAAPFDGSEVPPLFTGSNPPPEA